jgi:hypothetical protein
MFSSGACRASIGARLRRSLLVGVGVAAISLALASVALATTTIDTTPQWSGHDSSVSFGWGFNGLNTATYGQTVTVPATDTKLDSFTFYVDLPTELLFRGEVYAWDNNCPCATGPALYESSATHTTAYDPSGNSFQPIAFNTGGITLAAGQQYVLFATVSNDWDANTTINASGCSSDGPGCLDNFGYWGAIPSSPPADPYPGGNLVWIYNLSDTSAWTANPPPPFPMWQNFVSSGINDSAFKASFSSPLPASKAQCKNGGWKTYGVFKNDGDCVSFVASGGKNPPSGP